MFPYERPGDFSLDDGRAQLIFPGQPRQPEQSQGDDDKPHEECGVFGIFAPERDVARLTFFALYALQHRGQEGAGIATCDGQMLHIHKGMGLVSQVFNEDNLGHLHGNLAPSRR